jgi:hypothetical protein
LNHRFLVAGISSRRRQGSQSLAPSMQSQVRFAVSFINYSEIVVMNGFVIGVVVVGNASSQGISTTGLMLNLET